MYQSICIDTNEICSLNKKAESIKECEKLELNGDTYRCCYEESKYSKDGVNYGNKNCFLVTKDYYDRIASIIEEHRKNMEKDGYLFEKFSIDCFSYELNNSLVYLLSLILLYL